MFACICSFTSSSICSTSRSLTTRRARSRSADDRAPRASRPASRGCRAPGGARRAAGACRCDAAARPGAAASRWLTATSSSSRRAALDDLHAMDDDLGSAVVGVEDLASRPRGRRASRCRPPDRPIPRRPASVENHLDGLARARLAMPRQSPSRTIAQDTRRGRQRCRSRGTAAARRISAPMSLIEGAGLGARPPRGTSRPPAPARAGPPSRSRPPRASPRHRPAGILEDFLARSSGSRRYRRA